MSADAYTINFGPNGYAAMLFSGYAPNLHYSSPGMGTLYALVYCTIKGYPDLGYQVKSLTVDGMSPVSAPYSEFPIGYPSLSGHTYVAEIEFELIPVHLYVYINGVATVTQVGVGDIPSGQYIVIPHEGSVTLTVQPGSGYTIDRVYNGNTGVNFVPELDGSYVIHDDLVTGNGLRSFFVNLSRIPKTITASSGSHGTIDPSGSVSVPAGTNKTFTMTPNENYHIEDVLVDSVSVGNVGTYTFNNVVDNHSIAVSHALNEFVIRATAGPHGIIVPSGEITATYGDTKSFIITPDEYYVIQDVIVDGVVVQLPSSGILFID